MKKISILLLSLLALLFLAAVTLQSTWGREKALSLLTDSLKQSGLELTIGTVRGSFPQQIELDDVTVQSGSEKVNCRHLKLGLSLLRLLKKEIALSHFSADEITWTKEDGARETPIQKKGLSYLLNVERFSLTNVAMPQGFRANFEGHLRIGKKNRYAFFDITAKRSDFPDSSAHLLFAIHRDKTTLAKLTLDTPTLQALPFAFPYEAKTKLEATLEGPLSAFVEAKGTLEGHFQGNIVFQERSWDASGHIFRSDDLSWDVTKLKAATEGAKVKGKLHFDPQFRFESAQAEIQSDHLKMGPFEGRLFGHLNAKEDSLKATWRIPQLKIGSIKLDQVMGSYEGNVNHGAIQVDFKMLGEPWKAHSDIAKREDSWHFANTSINSSSNRLEGNFILPPTLLLEGTATFASDQLHTLSPLLFGQAQGHLSFSSIEETQSAQFDATASDFYWQAFHAETISLYSDLLHPFTEPEGVLSVEMEKGNWKTLALYSMSLHATSQEGAWPFTLFLDGEWKHPLTLNLNGIWQKGDLFIAAAKGSFFKHPLLLTAPLTLTWKENLFRLDPLSLNLGEGTLAASVQREGEKTVLFLQAKRVPLDFLSLNPLDVPIDGLFDFHADIKEVGSRLDGSLSGVIDQMVVNGDKREAVGEFAATLHRDLLKFQGGLNIQKEPLLKVDLTLPIHFELWPYTAELRLFKPAQGRIQFNGQVEDFLDFANLGTHRLEGECHADLSFSNTLAHPLINGYCEFENGSYQNYYTGTELTHLTAEWIGDKEALVLRKATGQDVAGKGSLSATGRLSLSVENDFLYRFDVALNHLISLSYDLMRAEIDGHVTLNGTWEKGLATGSLNLLEVDITVPDRIPRKLPDLQVVYKNPLKPTHLPSNPPKTPYPLHLDMAVNAPDGIFIAGRGLNSEWKGAFHLSGTQTALIAEGQIELIRGEFLFSGRHFKLTEGSVSMSGAENEMPFLNLAATIDVKDVSIIARLQGPVNDPQLTLHSAPPLPMGTIMAYLLFGQDMSEMNSFQALQLANSLSSLAGEGPDVLEQTRKSLGVDRLQIVSVPGASEEEEGTIALQVGKYVTEGVLVSLSQGADDASTNIAIEFEVKGGLSIVLESQQAQEQGKFTLKWRRNY